MNMRSMMAVFRRGVPAVLAAAVLPLLAATAEARNVKLVAAGGGQVRALVVGINEYASRSVPTLKGAAADARDLETTLRAAGVSDLIALIDADATRRNFETAINHLVDVSRAGDLAIITFAGHGSQQPELVKGSGSRRHGRDLSAVEVRSCRAGHRRADHRR
jgi:Caspase domain.